MIVTETLDNIAEHAYQSSEKLSSFGGLYARIRSGHPENADELQRWRTTRALEREHCPTLSRNNCGKQPGWLEIFVCDVGCGITTHIAASESAPLHQLTDKLFIAPISRIANRSAARRTEVTGLKHIGDILRRGAEEHGRTGFVRVYSNGEWAGEHLPWPHPENQASYNNYRRSSDSEPLKGTLLHFSVEPVTGGIVDGVRTFPNFFFLPTSADLEEVRNALGETGPNIFSASYHFVDLQEQTKFEGEPAGRGATVLNWMKKITSRTVIIRPPRSLRKNDLVYQLSIMGAAAPVKVSRVVFSDVPPSIAIDMGHLLHEEKLWQPWPNSDLTVYVLSHDWSCVAFRLNVDRQSFKVDRDAAVEFVHDRKGIKEGAALVGAVLRDQDSGLFWNKIKDGYVNEIIEWRSTIVTDTATRLEVIGYLDIPIALANETCYRIARRARAAYRRMDIERIEEVQWRSFGDAYSLDRNLPAP